MTTTSVVWGCTAAVVSSAIQSLGITLQRKSHVIPIILDHREDVELDHTVSDDGHTNGSIPLENRGSTVSHHAHDYEANRHTHLYRRHLWLIGFSMFILANVFGSIVQLTTLPLIILSPLQSIGLIFNSIFSSMLLPGESFTSKLIIGTAIISVGAFIIAYNGSADGESLGDIDTDERFRLVLQKFRRPTFLVWWIFTFVVILVLIRVNYVLSRRIHQLSLHKKGKRLSRNSKKAARELTLLKGTLFGVISGTLTAHTFLFAKSIVDVVVATLLERATPKSSATYVTSALLLLATLTIVAMQLVAFNLGLSHISTSILYPLCFLVYNLVNLFNGVLYDELLSKNLMTIPQLLLVVLGLIGVLLGVVMISWDSAFGVHEPISDDSDVLLNAKFPYLQASSHRVLSYEENELLKSIHSS
ncbi:hypothetical protein FT663_00434 [Candidozyma haemuli var. vulneris]|uniref:Uncharacterized protein n=1 Tax=Candidozyma haemuli TaxID=45357 RepID=A0A2V1ARL0_9ASCO|nr:hypothetical protein CXQ85_002301 [[Candida] haemuloni]KAF3993411.1 hypothetical protein FT662_00540 [[Candida] haemuloni var. vulneris]KAF3995381.1 hypothetical protein FT663_00434 [[Candida] haemuloni var. vulneris]PVH20509.1 hypothetical protein CXQ85_002301 [[Candida] haemuloni]